MDERAAGTVGVGNNIRSKCIYVSIYTRVYGERGRVGVVSASFTKSIEDEDEERREEEEE